MKLIVLDDDFPVFNPECRLIRDFNALITRDKGSKGDHDGRKKKLATKELAFVHFMVAHSSEFITSYSEDERAAKIKKHLDLPTDWTPDGLVEMAMITYKELTSTPSMDSLIEARESLFSANKIINILRRDLESQLQNLSGQLHDSSDDEKEQEKLDKLIDKTTKRYDKIMTIAKDMPVTLDTIQKLEDRVKKEMEKESKGRKGKEVDDQQFDI